MTAWTRGRGGRLLGRRAAHGRPGCRRALRRPAGLARPDAQARLGHATILEPFRLPDGRSGQVNEEAHPRRAAFRGPIGYSDDSEYTTLVGRGVPLTGTNTQPVVWIKRASGVGPGLPAHADAVVLPPRGQSWATPDAEFLVGTHVQRLRASATTCGCLLLPMLSALGRPGSGAVALSQVRHGASLPAPAGLHRLHLPHDADAARTWPGTISGRSMPHRWARRCPSRPRSTRARCRGQERRGDRGALPRGRGSAQRASSARRPWSWASTSAT